MGKIPEEAVKAAKDVLYYASPNDVERALAAALPFLPVQVAVKKLAWIRTPLSDTLSRCDTDFCTYRTWTHDEANGKWFWSVEGGWNEANGEAPNEDAAKAAAQADYEARILSALEPSAARELALVSEEAVTALSNYMQADEDGIMVLVSRQAIEECLPTLRALSSPDHADAGKVEGDGSAAARDVLAERRRQVSAEGWTPEHDDTHTGGEMAGAAACYALYGATYNAPSHYPPRKVYAAVAEDRRNAEKDMDTTRDAIRMAIGEPKAPKNWPWNAEWWKPSDRRRNLVKAAALILAEIERLDRKASEGGSNV